MIVEGIKFKGHPCFKQHWSGFDAFLPINLIIGKNNSGKSHLLQFVNQLSSEPIGKSKYPYRTYGILDEDSLKDVFHQHLSGGQLGGNHWQSHGCLLIDLRVGYDSISNELEDLEDSGRLEQGSRNSQTLEARVERIQEAVKNGVSPIFGKRFRHLLADRDIRPEPTSNTMLLNSDGSGATNIVRRFLNSSNPRFQRDLIRKDMLEALNDIFGEDGNFLEISIQHLDGNDKEKAEDLWEIYLSQEHKGLVALSQSGSSLKTIFLVLLNLLVIPGIDSQDKSKYVFAFEELENNLHPSLLRRLLGYLEDFATGTTADDEEPPSLSLRPAFFLTTHSNVALDYFAGRKHAQIIHVSHDGKSGKTQTIAQSARQLDVIRDLGCRASDLLQANGIIWVEGPSDRVYLNRWIELLSNGELEEGRHYQCMFYGGGLLANLGFGFDETEIGELINLLKINPNVVVVSDSDKSSKHARLKERVRRIRDEFKELDSAYSLHWILEAREIENYLTADLIRHAEPKTSASAKDPEQFESFFPKKSTPTGSYLEKVIKRKSFDKMELALSTTPHMDTGFMATRFDLEKRVSKIVELIGNWNP
ncbi:ATP-dependent nuclease [Roseibacillus persicicus]|uniref:ATP-dependent nuclease n=1 Tax=Roseibacillus persicicus TaxID=454148 RepID=UPI00280E298A|nr:AAA family ATPase [Roseibacillus persicicus]MDQ8192447.1 AAA family ATPase [Roseibacillus persicicus]